MPGTQGPQLHFPLHRHRQVQEGPYVRGRQGARTGSQMLWAGGEAKGESASVLKKKKTCSRSQITMVKVRPEGASWGLSRREETGGGGRSRQ